MSVLVEAVAVAALRGYLLRQLPAKVAVLNAESVSLVAPYAGPYTLPNNGGGACAFTFQTETSTVTSSLTSGVRTAQQVAAQIVPGGAYDDQGRLLLTVPAPLKLVNVLPDDGTKATVNEVFGFDRGGNRTYRPILVAPKYAQFCDGWPTHPQFGSAGCINIVIDDRSSTPTGDAPLRRDEFAVSLDVAIFIANPDGAGNDKLGINRAVRAVREVLIDNAGRALGQEQPAVKLVEEESCQIRGMPLTFDSHPGVLFDAALLKLRLKVFEYQG